MLITPAASIRSSEITDKRLYVNRRTFIRSVAGATLATAGAMLGAEGLVQAAEAAPHGRKLASVKASTYSTDERANTWEQVTTYNNYYEFGTDKEQPARLARTLVTEPWTVTVEGECHKPAVYHLEDVLKGKDARRSRLSASLRRSVVDGDSVGRVPALRLHQEV